MLVSGGSSPEGSGGEFGVVVWEEAGGGKRLREAERNSCRQVYLAGLSTAPYTGYKYEYPCEICAKKFAAALCLSAHMHAIFARLMSRYIRLSNISPKHTYREPSMRSRYFVHLRDMILVVALLIGIRHAADLPPPPPPSLPIGHGLTRLALEPNQSPFRNRRRRGQLPIVRLACGRVDQAIS